MRDVVVLLMMVLGFGLLLTAQLRLVFVLLLEIPRWRGLLAFLFPPFAVLYGWRAGRRINVVVWLTSALIYLAGFGASYWGR